MRLGRTLFRILADPGQLAPGKITTGKNRIYPKITRGEIEQAKFCIKMTERNMLLLRHPYLTIKESYGHEEELHDPVVIKFHKEREELLEMKAFKTPDCTMEQRFAAVDRTHSWDG